MISIDSVSIIRAHRQSNHSRSCRRHVLSVSSSDQFLQRPSTWRLWREDLHGSLPDKTRWAEADPDNDEGSGWNGLWSGGWPTMFWWGLIPGAEPRVTVDCTCDTQISVYTEICSVCVHLLSSYSECVWLQQNVFLKGLVHPTSPAHQPRPQPLSKMVWAAIAQASNAFILPGGLIGGGRNSTGISWYCPWSHADIVAWSQLRVS